MVASPSLLLTGEMKTAMEMPWHAWLTLGGLEKVSDWQRHTTVDVRRLFFLWLAVPNVSSLSFLTHISFFMDVQSLLQKACTWVQVCQKDDEYSIMTHITSEFIRSVHRQMSVTQIAALVDCTCIY